MSREQSRTWDMAISEALRLKKEDGVKRAIHARLWPGLGWAYYCTRPGSRAEKGLREWRRLHEMATSQGWSPRG